MEFSIDDISVEALYDCAQKLLLVLDGLQTEDEKISQIFYNVSEKIGPHSCEMEEFLQKLLIIDSNAKAVIEELAVHIMSVAARMQCFIHHKEIMPNNVPPDNDPIDRHRKCIEERIDGEATNPIVREFLYCYQSFIKVGDFFYKGTPFYSLVKKEIYLSVIADLHEPRGKLTVYFHEVGHLLDNVCGERNEWLSSDSIFIASLQKDFNRYIEKYMIDNNCERDMAYDSISGELCGTWMAGVSDIVGGLTCGACQGDYGHHPDYWNLDESIVAKEAFAWMFESSIGDSNKLLEMKKYFPTAYVRFEVLLEKKTNGANNRGISAIQ